MTLTAAIPLQVVSSETLETLSDSDRTWVESTGFKAAADTFCLIPNSHGSIQQVLVGFDGQITPWTLGAVATQLPAHHYQLASEHSPQEKTLLCLGWHLGQYKFSQYQAHDTPLPTLDSPTEINQLYLDAAQTATHLVRDLINAPANDMGPAELEEQAQQIANQHQARFHTIQGDELLTQNYPMIYAVGAASTEAPRLLDLKWGQASHPKITLVGKGVCFDSGGLDLKSASGMLKMKKDMGGAAHVLGVALMIMALQLPVQLRVLIPAVENSVAGNAMRPLDVLRSRKGTTVEVGNTDAEGRLVLADALWEASAEKPELLIDFATLTGAARVALGTELPACFSNRPELAQQLMEIGESVHDPLWALPLHKPYRNLLDSKVADISNISSGSYGGAITAALFLQEFIEPSIDWIHIDVMAWNVRALPGRPEGGEAMGIRAVYGLIESWVQTQS